VEQRSENLIKQYFHSPDISQYPALFDAFSEELRREFETDVGNLWGLGIPKMRDSLIILLLGKLHKLRSYIDPKEFDTVSKQIFIKTVDDLRINHNSVIRDVLLSMQLCGYGQKKTVAEFIGHVMTAEKQLENEIVEAFLPRIFKIQPKTTRRQIFEPRILKDIHEILV
jgi:preprotein translocase subunit SecA